MCSIMQSTQMEQNKRDDQANTEHKSRRIQCPDTLIGTK